METRFRPGKWLFLLLSCILTAAMTLCGLSLGDLLRQAVSSPGLSGPFEDTFLSYASFLGIWFVFLSFLVIAGDRGTLRSLWRQAKGNTPLSVLLGLLTGALLNGFCVLAAVLRGELVLSCSSLSLFRPALLLFAVLIQSGAEELACRAFLYRRVLRAGSPSQAVLISSLLFSVMHLGNAGISPAGVCCSFLLGVFLSLVIFYWDSFWFAACFHASWNFSQNILFGLPNSGRSASFSVFEAACTAPDTTFFCDPSFGPEGTAFACLLLASAAAAVFFFGGKQTR